MCFYEAGSPLTPLVSTPERQRQVGLCELRGQPGPHLLRTSTFYEVRPMWIPASALGLVFTLPSVLTPPFPSERSALELQELMYTLYCTDNRSILDVALWTVFWTMPSVMALRMTKEVLGLTWWHLVPLRHKTASSQQGNPRARSSPFKEWRASRRTAVSHRQLQFFRQGKGTQPSFQSTNGHYTSLVIH